MPLRKTRSENLPLPTFVKEPPTSPQAGAYTDLPFVPYLAATELPANWNHIILVGEAPGADEVKFGRPFVGRSGQLLNKALQEATINREQCLVMNVFRRQPPKNKIDYFFLSQRAAEKANLPIATQWGPFNKKYVWQEAAADIENLFAEIMQIDQICLRKTAGEKESPPSCRAPSLQFKPPFAIISLGRTPLWALTGQEGLLTKVGQPTCLRLPTTKNESQGKITALYNNPLVFPTFHPSFILRGNWNLMPDWVNHFASAQNFLNLNCV